MKQSHVALSLCAVSIILFIVALSGWSPFYVAVGPEFSVLTVKVTLDGKPVGNVKVDVYDFLTPLKSPPLGVDPATLGAPVKEDFTNYLGEATFVLSPGNYTVRVESPSFGWTFENVILREHEQEVRFDLYAVHQEHVKGTFLTPSLSYANVIMLCIASALMAVGIVIFVQSRRK